ncbi:biotin transporter BioY [Arhodomonas sp. AD133]|uniref:biotin transporter BioY n=1 Tax=Arhodomonas sp. AD133 TaxID=3415009 RepID=UPI003EBF87B3
MTLGAWLGREEVGARERVLGSVVSVLVGSALLALATRVEIPFWPVPLNMQTFVVLTLGLIYGPALGLATVLTYIAEGLAGLPVFAHGGGPAYIAGPTGGYLIGFAAAAWTAGQLAHRGWLRNPVTAVAAALIANIVVYLFGVSWLAVVLGDAGKAVAVGLTPFLLGAALKVTGAGLLAHAFDRWR